MVDNGSREAKAFSVSENLGRLLENQAAETSLFRNDKETDFCYKAGCTCRKSYTSML